MPRLSIVVFCFNDTQLLEETLVSVLQNRPDNSEVLVMHDGTYEDPYDLVDEVRFIEASGVQSMTQAANLAMQNSRGLIVHFLAGGVVPEANWSEVALKHFDEEDIVAVVPLLLHEKDASVACLGIRQTGLHNRALVGFGRKHLDVEGLESDGPNLVAAFYRKSQLLSLGGFREDLGDEYSDLDAGLRLQEVGDVVTAADCVLRVGRCDKPRRVSASSCGRLHHRFLTRQRESMGAFRYHASTWLNSILEIMTAPRSPSRLLSALSRLNAWRKQHEMAETVVEAGAIFSIESARRQHESQESDASVDETSRRAA